MVCLFHKRPADSPDHGSITLADSPPQSKKERTIIQLPTVFPPPCLAPAQNSVQKPSENHAKLVRIEARGTSRGSCGALLGFPLAQRAKIIQNVSSWTALGGPSETPNLSKLGRRRPNASQKCAQNLMSESCSKKLLKSDKKVTLD